MAAISESGGYYARRDTAQGGRPLQQFFQTVTAITDRRQRRHAGFKKQAVEQAGHSRRGRQATRLLCQDEEWKSVLAEQAISASRHPLSLNYGYVKEP